MTRPGKELNNFAVVSIDEGRLLGRVQDIYLSPNLDALAGLFMGSQGILKRKALLVPRAAITVLGVDAILVRDGSAMSDDQQLPDAKNWVRREKLTGREINTPGGTKLGIIGDVSLGDDGTIEGFILSKVHVSGPLAELKLINRQAVLDIGHDGGPMTADLSTLEQSLAGGEIMQKEPAADSVPADPRAAEPLVITVDDEPKAAQ